MVKVIYSFFLGLLLACFVGFGINTFYTQPAAPSAPDFGYVGKEGLTKAQEDKQMAFEKTRRNYETTQLNPYNRNVSVMALAASVIFIALSLLLTRHNGTLADSAALGGIFTLLYSLGRAMAANNNGYVFTAVSIGLVIVLVLGYIRFVSAFSRQE